ncbi:hypothetical protein D3C77_610690 [compost metagenome]
MHQQVRNCGALGRVVPQALQTFEMSQPQVLGAVVTLIVQSHGAVVCQQSDNPSQAKLAGLCGKVMGGIVGRQTMHRCRGVALEQHTERTCIDDLFSQEGRAGANRFKHCTL